MGVLFFGNAKRDRPAAGPGRSSGDCRVCSQLAGMRPRLLWVSFFTVVVVTFVFANLFAKFGFFFLYIVNRKQLILFLSRLFFAINIVYCFLEFSYFSCIYLALFAKERDPNPNIKNVSSFVCLMLLLLLLSSLVAYYIHESASKRLQDVKFPYHL